MGTLEGERIELSADSSEPITGIHVTEGDHVRKGDLLLVQDTARLLARLHKAEANLESAKARLEQAQAGPRIQQIEKARAEVAAASSSAKTAKFELDRAVSLVKEEFASQNTVDILKGKYEEALARRDAARAKLNELMEGTRLEELKAAESSVSAAGADVEEIRVSLERARVQAPVDGWIEAVPFEIGERPVPGQVVIVMIRDTRPYARVYVPEVLRSRLKIGSRADIHIDGYDIPYPGEVRWIAREASFTPYYALTQRDRGHLSFLAEITLPDQNTEDLPLGIPVEVTFPDVPD